MSRVKRIAFDKTGTLTEGNFKLLHLRTWGKLNKIESLKYVYALEAHANHPIAAAMISAAKVDNVDFPSDWNIEDHQIHEGEGLKATINSQDVHIGNLRMFDRIELLKDVPEEELKLGHEWLEHGNSVGFLSVGDLGIVCSYCIADSIRSEAKQVISSLHKLGIDAIMLTGDNTTTATSIGRGLGLTQDQIESNLLPHEKLDLINKMIQVEKDRSANRSSHGSRPGLIMMVGDGVNDAPALALADVSVAMGAGATLAMETADITLLDSNLNKLLSVIKLGKRVTRTIIENVVFSFVVKAVVMGFAFAGYSILWAAIASDVGAMLLVTLNGMKLLPSKKSLRSGFIQPLV